MNKQTKQQEKIIIWHFVPYQQHRTEEQGGGSWASRGCTSEVWEQRCRRKVVWARACEQAEVLLGEHDWAECPPLCQVPPAVPGATSSAAATSCDRSCQLCWVPSACQVPPAVPAFVSRQVLLWHKQSLEGTQPSAKASARLLQHQLESAANKGQFCSCLWRIINWLYAIPETTSITLFTLQLAWKIREYS